MSIELVVNNPAPVSASNVVPMVKKPKKPAKKKLTPKQRFRRDVSELGELSDHLFAAADAMSNTELIAFRARVALILEAVRSVKEATDHFVVVTEDAE